MFFSLCWTKRKQKYIKRNCPHSCRAPDFTYKDKKVTTLKQRRQKSILKKKHGLAQLVMNLPAMQETPVRFLCREAPLEKGKATHSSILAWRIPWIVWFMGSQKSRRRLRDLHFTSCKTNREKRKHLDSKTRTQFQRTPSL